MSPWLARMLGMLFGSGMGALVGGLVGTRLGLPVAGAVLGVLLAVGFMVAADSAGARRLMAWLRAPVAGSSAIQPGLWGEIHFRVDKALKLRDDTITYERSQLQQFLSAIEASPNGVLLLDAQDELVWCNAVAGEHFRLDSQRDLGQRVTNLVRHPTFVSHIQGKGADGSLVMPVEAGRTTLSILTRRYGQGMRLVLSQDITERERADAMRRDFVANVSHEIRTPLTVLAGFVETMASLPLTEVERKRVMVLMEQQTSRMQALVGDLLALAKLEGSPRPPADEWTGVHALMRHVISDATILSDGRHRLNLQGGTDAEIAGSHGELLSAVANLVNNAVRYTPQGGEISLYWRWRDDGGGVFEVADTGPGIAPEHLSRVTERFYRVDSSRSRDTGGTGLGLSIVKHVAQRHGGDIEVQSELGKGSNFRLSLPPSRVRRVPAAVPDSASLALQSS
jgi:two-component system, OmpR family, phosphate regulon sensor histidine kinase PhoR